MTVDTMKSYLIDVREAVMATPKPEQPKGLRRAAELLEDFEGYRTEIIGGTLMMSPTPRYKHARILNRIHDQLLVGLPEDFEDFQVGSITSPQAGEDYATPDLVVLPSEWGESDEWLAPADLVELVVEVVSKSNPTSDTIDKVAWYANAHIPLYLLVDPRNGTWKLYATPADGRYRSCVEGDFKESIDLPQPFGFSLSTDDFKTYDR